MNVRRAWTSLFTALLMIATLSLPASAQDADGEPLLEELRDTFKNEYFSVGMIVKTVADFRPERPASGTNGFDVATARLNVTGSLDGGFGYQLQTDVTRSPAVLDARVRYRKSPGFNIDAGLFKSPFSHEFLRGIGELDFVLRSQVVRSLAPNRQVGVNVYGRTDGGLLHYSLGAFNGNGRDLAGNDDNSLMVVGRLEARPELSEGSLMVGVNGARNEEDGGLFQGTRLLAGGDVRYVRAPLLISAEFIYADLSPDAAGADLQQSGYQATLGYLFSENRQVLVRWDTYTDDLQPADRDFVVFGYNHEVTGAVRFQLNYMLPVWEDAEAVDNRIMANLQIAF